MLPPKRSAFIVLINEESGQVYCVRGRGGDCGVPGGKGEPVDLDDFTIAAREFLEETGAQPPGTVCLTQEDGRVAYAPLSYREFYSYVAYGDRYHNCTFFYKLLSPEACSNLPVGESPDPQGTERDVEWCRLSDCWHQLRNHVRTGIRFIQGKDPRIHKITRNNLPAPKRAPRRRPPSPGDRKSSASAPAPAPARGGNACRELSARLSELSMGAPPFAAGSFG